MADTDDIDYDDIARAAEAKGDLPPLHMVPKVPTPDPTPDDGPQLAEQEVQTKGPVIIDTVTGAIRHAETGEQLLAPVPADEPERELDLTYVALGLSAAAGIIAVVAAALAQLSASQKCAIVAVIIMVMGERLWWEIRRVPTPTEPEGVAYVTSESSTSGYDQQQ